MDVLSYLFNVDGHRSEAFFPRRVLLFRPSVLCRLFSEVFCLPVVMLVYMAMVEKKVHMYHGPECRRLVDARILTSDGPEMGVYEVPTGAFSASFAIRPSVCPLPQS